MFLLRFFVCLGFKIRKLAVLVSLAQENHCFYCVFVELAPRKPVFLLNLFASQCLLTYWNITLYSGTLYSRAQRFCHLHTARRCSHSAFVISTPHGAAARLMVDFVFCAGHS